MKTFLGRKKWNDDANQLISCLLTLFNQSDRNVFLTCKMEKCLQHCKGSLIGQCQKHDADVWSQPSWSTKWRGPKYLALTVSGLLLTIISSDWLRAGQSNCVILIDSDLPKVKCKEKWHVVILSLSTSFLTWNVNGIQDTLFPKWKWNDWCSQY